MALVYTLSLAVLVGVSMVLNKKNLDVVKKNQETLKEIINGVSKSDKEVDLSNLENQLKAIRDESYDMNSKTRLEITQLFGTLSTSLNDNTRNVADNTNKSLDTIKLNIDGFLKEFKSIQSNKFDDFGKKQEDILKETQTRLEEMTKQQNDLVKSTETRLDEMKDVVSEKLESTLSVRIGDSFKQVSDQLESVYKSIGEMQSLANNVGDLKRVLSNVKTRGIFGEVQLENILEQFLGAGQYEKEVTIKPTSRERVEFVVKLPGRDNDTVYLPIDSKFPMDIYNNLVNASIEANAEDVAKYTKELHTFIKKSAKDISSKYIDIPRTTEFAILFLPTEGLYAEVVKDSGLIESVQKEYKIIISGPNTLSALLTSLQVGFRTLAIEKKSSEVWEVLSAVKEEFIKFEKTLDSTQKKLLTASNELDRLVGTRTKAINRRLKNVEILPNTSDVIDMDDYETEDKNN